MQESVPWDDGVVVVQTAADVDEQSQESVESWRDFQSESLGKYLTDGQPKEGWRDSRIGQRLQTLVVVVLEEPDSSWQQRDDGTSSVDCSSVAVVGKTVVVAAAWSILRLEQEDAQLETVEQIQTVQAFLSSKPIAEQE